MTTLGDALLSTRHGAAFLACGAAVGRMRETLADPGLTLCLAAHALGEVRRGTDSGRLATFVEAPGPWLVDAAAEVDRADTTWWSSSVGERVVRRVAPTVTGVEVFDVRGRRRSAAEEANAHLHTFSSRPALTQPRRLRIGSGTPVVTVDGAADITDVVRAGVRVDPPRDSPAVQLTLRGALTIDRALLPRWPWQVAGVHWPHGIPANGTDEEPTGPEPRVVHDYDWAPIGRPYDPRFDEGHEIDGSELHEDGLTG